MSFTFYRPAESELPELAKLYRDFRAAADMPLVPNYFKALPDEVYATRWKKVFAQPDLYSANILLKDGVRAGFSVAGPMDEEDREAFMRGCDLPKNCGELHQMYLSPDVQGQGMGRVLYEQVMVDMRSMGHEGFTLCTYQENERAIGFYKAMGAQWLKDDTLHLTFSGKLWHRPVTFMVHSL